MRLVVSAVVVWFCCVVMGCATGSRVDDEGGGGGSPTGTRLEIRPETAALVAAYGERPEQAFSVVVVHEDGRTDDVTDRVERVATGLVGARGGRRRLSQLVAALGAVRADDRRG